MRFSKCSTMIDSRAEETDISIQPTNNDTENDRDEPFSENVNSDMEIRTTFLQKALKKLIYKIIMIARAKTKAFPRQ